MGNSKGFKNLCKLHYHFVYQTKNLVNGKTYIGRHSTNNLDDGYLGSGTLLKRAIKKYGKENFQCIHMCYFDTYQEAVEEEKFLVTKEYCAKDDNYNIVEGGENPIMYGDKNPSWKGGVLKYNSCRCGNIKVIKSNSCKTCFHKIQENHFPKCPLKIRECVKKATKTKIEKGLTVKIKADNVIFESIFDCVRQYNIHESTVRSRCVSPHFPEWEFLDREKQKEESLKYYAKVTKRYAKKREATAQKRSPLIHINNEVFYTYQEAAKKFNLNYETIQRRCVSIEYPDWIFIDKLEKEKITVKITNLLLRKKKNRRKNKS